MQWNAQCDSLEQKLLAKEPDETFTYAHNVGPEQFIIVRPIYWDEQQDFLLI